MVARKKQRRPKGTGGLHQRGDGMWIAQVRTPGHPPWQKGRKRYEDAQAVLTKMLRDIEDGIDPSTGSLTVEKWMTVWLADIAYERLKPNTLATYRSTVKKQILPQVGSKRLDKLQPADVRKMVKTVAAATTTRTAQAAFNILSKALGDAVNDGKLRSNPCDRMDRPQAKSEERQPLTVDQARTLLLHVASRDVTTAARWALSLLTGARQAEALGLTWDRVDFTRHQIDIRWQLQRLKLTKGRPRPTGTVYPPAAFDVPDAFDFIPVWRSACLIPTKTKGSTRVVPLIPPAEAALKAHWEACGRPTSGLVFTRGDGAAMEKRDDTRAWREVCVAAGIVTAIEDAPDQHCGRHTVATLLQEAGVEESTRMAILGHTTVTAHRGYAHTSTDITRAALGELERLLQLDR